MKRGVLSNAPTRPILAPACAFLVGVAAGAGAFHPWPLAAGGLIAAGVAMALRRRRWARFVLVAVVAGSAGIHSMRAARADADGAVDRWVARRGESIALSVVGTVRSLAERDTRGGWSVRLRARREGDDGAPSLRLLLAIARADGPAATAIDSLRPGDEIRVWCQVRRPSPEVNPERSDRETQLRARGIELEGTVKSARLIARQRTGTTSFLRVIAVAKAFARRRLDRALGDDPLARPLVGAMLLGDRAGVEPRIERLLRDAGLVHLLSVSGLHVALVILALWTVLTRVRLRRLVRLTLMLGGIASLVAFVGTDAPVLRAGICAALLLVGHAIGRDGDPMNTLAGVAALLCAIDPYVLFNLGFQLSFAATAGILCLARPIAASLPLPKGIAIAIGVSSAAYLGSAPLALLHFGRAAPVSLLSNLAASTVCAATMAAGAGIVAFGSAAVVGPASACAARVSAHALVGIADLAARVPGGAFQAASPGSAVLAAYYLALAAAVCLSERAPRGAGIPELRSFLPRLVRLATALLLLALHLGPPPGAPARDVEVDVLDVGQGQAVVIRGPTGGFVLVDAGGTGGGRFDAGERIVAPFLAARGCRRIDAVLVTHSHDDHAGGVHAILRDFEVGELWLSAGFHRDPAFVELAAEARASGTALVLAERGTSWRRAGLELRILHPSREQSPEVMNDQSIVVVAEAGGRRLLIPGDLEGEGERSVLRSGAEVRADLLVVGHHGSRSSTTATFLAAVDPVAAIVSCGAGNRFGHPAAEVLERLHEHGTSVWRTDREGSIRARIGPVGVEVESSVREP